MNEGLVDLVARVLDPRAPARAASHAAELIADEGVDGLSRCDASAIESRLAAHGFRNARAAGAALAAAFELGRRVVVECARVPTTMASGADVAAWANPRLASLTHEELWVLALDGRSRLRAAHCVAKGGLHGLGARPADPLRFALRADASAFVLVHNHPSGDPTPSREDVTFTASVAAAGEAAHVPLLDHVVVAREGFASVPFTTEA